MDTPAKPKKRGKSLLFKIVFAVLALAALGLLGVVVASHYALAIANYEVQKISGFSLAADQQSINPFAGSVDFKGLQMTNPGTFPAPDFVRFNEVRTKVEPLSLLSKRIVIDEIVVDLDSAAVVQTKDGNFNIMTLVNAFLGGDKSAASAPARAKTASLAIPPFIIKTLTLRINEARYLDYNHSNGKPQVVKLAYERTFTNVTDADIDKTVIAVTADLYGKGAVFLAQALGSAVLDPATYANLLKGGFQAGVEVVQGAASVVGGATSTAGKALSGAASTVGGLLNLGGKK